MICCVDVRACAFVLFLAIPMHAADFVNPAKVIDLTHSFDATTIYWPTEEGFQWEKEIWGKTGKGLLLRLRKVRIGRTRWNAYR